MTFPTAAERRRARESHERLTLALVALGAAGGRTNCSDPVTSELWLSEFEAERQLAVSMCQGCAVLDPCGDVGQYERYYVWAGIDRSKRPKLGRPPNVSG